MTLSKLLCWAASPCLAFGVIAAAPSSAQVGNMPALPTTPGTVVFFDFFFSDDGGAPAEDFNNFVQWNVTGGSVDLVGGFGPGVFGAPPNNPFGRYVDLGGSTGNPGMFSTRLPLDILAGATYELSFMYRSTLPGQTNFASASFGGQTFNVSSSNEAFAQFSQSFVVNSVASSTIAFQGLKSDTDNSGIGIDGVLLRIVGLPGGGVPTDPGLPISGAVPEPTTWAMMLLGFAGIGFAMRRTKRPITTSVTYT